MHTARVIAAMIAGGYASILAAHLIAQTVPYGTAVSPGVGGFLLGPLAVGLCAAIIAALLLPTLDDHP